jgi:hypothetical protein
LARVVGSLAETFACRKIRCRRSSDALWCRAMSTRRLCWRGGRRERERERCGQREGLRSSRMPHMPSMASRP